MHQLDMRPRSASSNLPPMSAGRAPGQRACFPNKRPAQPPGVSPSQSFRAVPLTLTRSLRGVSVQRPSNCCCSSIGVLSACAHCLCAHCLCFFRSVFLFGARLLSACSVTLSSCSRSLSRVVHGIWVFLCFLHRFCSVQIRRPRSAH